MGTTKNNSRTKWAWTDAERQAFADGVRVRAQRIPNKKRIASRNACRRGGGE